MDAGEHSRACSDAVSGTCHCDCKGTEHGIAHIGKAGQEAKKKLIIAAAVKGPNGGVSHYRVVRPDGLPPGGGTPEERANFRAGKVDVKSARKEYANRRRGTNDVRAGDTVRVEPNRHSTGRMDAGAANMSGETATAEVVYDDGSVVLYRNGRSIGIVNARNLTVVNTADDEDEDD